MPLLQAASGGVIGDAGGDQSRGEFDFLHGRERGGEAKEKSMSKLAVGTIVTVLGNERLVFGDLAPAAEETGTHPAWQ